MILTFGLFAIAVCSVWFKDVKISHYSVPLWPIILSAAIMSGVNAQYLEVSAVIWIAIFVLLSFLSKKTQSYRLANALVLIAVGCMAFLMAIGKLSGFNDPVIVTDMRFSPEGLPFTHRLHIERIVVGIILLATFCNPARSWTEWPALLTKTTPIVFAALFAVFGFGLLVGYVAIDVKFIPYTIVFFITNLLFTCVFEESFFRGFLQDNFSKLLARWKAGAIIAVGLSAILFGLVHFKGGLVYVALATLAGIFYGYAKYRVKRIEAAILTHFSVNAIHFVAFTYPNF